MHSCIRFYLAVQSCTKLHMAAQGCSWLYMAVNGCTRLYMAVQKGGHDLRGGQTLGGAQKVASLNILFEIDHL